MPSSVYYDQFILLRGQSLSASFTPAFLFSSSSGFYDGRDFWAWPRGSWNICFAASDLSYPTDGSEGKDSQSPAGYFQSFFVELSKRLLSVLGRAASWFNFVACQDECFGEEERPGEDLGRQERRLSKPTLRRLLDGVAK